MHTRDAGAQLAQQRLRVLPRRPIHGQQRGVADVLQRDVDVFDDFGERCNCVNQLVCEVAGVRVQDADPLDALDVGQRGKQVRQATAVSPWEVLAILVRVLCNQVQLPHAAGRQASRLIQHIVPGLAAELAAEGGDGAESALVVAALSDAQVRRVARRQRVPVPLRPEGHRGGAHQHARGLTRIPLLLLAQRAVQLARQLRIILEAHDQVNLRAGKAREEQSAPHTLH